MSRQKQLVKTLFTLALLFAASSLQAQTPSAAGMVEEISGTVGQDLQPYMEIPDESTIELSADAQLTFFHYQTCQRVSVAGPGAVEVKKARYEVKENAHIAGEEPLQAYCVQELETSAAPRSEGSRAGAVVMRAFVVRPTLITNKSVLILTGAHAHKFSRLKVYLDERLIAELNVTGRRLPWPQNSKLPDQPTDYVLRVDAPQVEPLEVVVTAAASGPGVPLALISTD